MSRLCLGTLTFGLEFDEAQSHAIMDKASAGGIDFFDAADVYPLGGGLTTASRTEEIVGYWLKGKRHEPGIVGGTEFSVNRFGGDTARASAVYAGTVPLTADDIVEAASWVLNLPLHVNINCMAIMPICQAPGPLQIERS